MQSATTFPQPSTAHRREANKAVVATVIGNGLEWFDFTVYSFFSVIIAKVFFPTASELTSYLLALATFGVGFFMRPVGGILLGIYSDRRGRKAALSLTILLMAAGTLIIAVTPGYAQWGLFAPALIVFARLLQGFSAGGEMGSATAFLTEHAPAGQKAYYSSWIQASIGVAVALGAGAGALLSALLTPEQLESWGWRLPFLFGSLIGPVGFYIRSRIDETPAYTARAIRRAVACGVRTIEHGNLVDRETAQLMRERGAFAVPTQVTYEMLAEHGARYGLPADSVAKIEDVRLAGRRALEFFAEAGVPMGYGSDLLGEMHEYQTQELRIRAEVLGNLEALRSATSVAARILEREGELGCIAAGALADLLVVDGDPLTDISCLVGQGERLDVILQGGRLVKNRLG